MGQKNSIVPNAIQSAVNFKSLFVENSWVLEIFGFKIDDVCGVEADFEDAAVIICGHHGQALLAFVGTNINGKHAVIQGLFAIVCIANDDQPAPLDDGRLQHVLGATTDGFIHVFMLSYSMFFSTMFNPT